MRSIFAGGASLIALAIAAPAAAQTGPEPGQEEQTQSYEGQETGIDTLVPADDVAAEPAPAIQKTGDPILDRLNALEAKVRALEARNKQLEDQAAETATRVEKVEVRAAKGVQPGVAPTFADVTDNFSFKPRGTFQIDYAAYNARAGGYDFNNGTQIRRGRFGFDGTAWRTFRYRIEAEFVNNSVNLLDAYVQYAGIPQWLFTVGQQKTPFGLEANTSDAFNTFLERGMANVAFGAVGAERRIGATIAYQTDRLNATIGVFGAGEAVNRNAVTPDETYSVNGRLSWAPILDAGRLVHLGASAYHVTNLAGNMITLADRPNSRIDDGRIISAAIPGGVSPTGVKSGAKDATFVGAESALVYGPFSVQGEYGHLSVDRFGAEPSLDFDGFYAFASFFLTGESRTFRNGAVDRLRPFADFNPQNGGWGAFELAFRYDQLDLTDTALSPLKRKAHSYTGALNWHLNGNLKLLFNYIRAKGTNSPLVVAPVTENGTTAKVDIFQTRLQLDF
ncbi:porin [Sphingomonas oleivorans]|uniref:Porin n=1 Tax=Sphingomonas oleivorans TaxID=1735121 RepID=A0A2T5FXU4_9SPHN|nr:porin [Sphingomonas oleivorans]PTQ10960.1 porin [Sphingomonas oleivorans]